ncbi:hypothetical protein AB0M34_29940 [Nocardia sp. NPDC050193]
MAIDLEHSRYAGFREDYPEPLRELFDLDELGTGTGFLSVELFGMLLPTLFLVFAITFHQAIEGGPLGAGLPAAYGWLPAAGAVALVTGLPVFHRRDSAGV